MHLKNKIFFYLIEDDSKLTSLASTLLKSFLSYFLIENCIFIHK